MGRLLQIACIPNRITQNDKSQGCVQLECAYSKVTKLVSECHALMYILFTC